MFAFPFLALARIIMILLGFQIGGPQGSVLIGFGILLLFFGFFVGVP